MNSGNFLFYGIMFLGIFIAGVAQILLKKSAGKQYTYWWRQYVNAYVISGYALMVLSTVCTVIAMRKVPLTSTPVWNSMGILWATFWGRVIFKERLSKDKGIGVVLVLIGIIVFSL